MTVSTQPSAVEPLYGQIAQLLLRVLPRDWQRTRLAFAWVGPYVSESIASYEDEAGRERSYSTWDIGDELDETFLSLGQLMEGSGHPRWETATFTLDRSGHFTLDFGYPDEEAPRTSRRWDVEEDA